MFILQSTIAEEDQFKHFKQIFGTLNLEWKELVTVTID